MHRTTADDEDFSDDDNQNGESNYPVCPHCDAEIFDEEVTFCPRCHRMIDRSMVEREKLPRWVIATAMLLVTAIVLAYLLLLPRG